MPKGIDAPGNKLIVPPGLTPVPTNGSTIAAGDCTSPAVTAVCIPVARVPAGCAAFARCPVAHPNMVSPMITQRHANTSCTSDRSHFPGLPAKADVVINNRLQSRDGTRYLQRLVQCGARLCADMQSRSQARASVNMDRLLSTIDTQRNNTNCRSRSRDTQHPYITRHRRCNGVES